MYRASKYRAQKVETADGKFDSKHELKRWNELILLERAGEIKDLKRQVKYELIPAQRVNGRCVERACSYVADFEYIYKGSKVVEDAKGFKTPEYRIKKKLMLERYGIRIQEV